MTTELTRESATTSPDDLCYLTATEAIKRFKSRELSPVELMEAVIQRSEEVDPFVNAYTETHFERALSQARDAEARYAQDGEVRRLDPDPFVRVRDLRLQAAVRAEPVGPGSQQPGAAPALRADDAKCCRRGADAERHVRARPDRHHDPPRRRRAPGVV